VTDFDPNISWSFDLPPQLKLAIADAVTLYSKIDSCVLETIWVLEQAPLARKKQLSRQFSADNMKAIETAVRSIPGAESDAIWPTVKALRDERNLIAHGVWMIASNGRPVVVWHRKFLESEPYVTGEYFDYRRFNYFLDRGAALLQTFAEFKKLLEEAIGDERRSREESLP
jgi:hypothetical protein